MKGTAMIKEPAAKFVNSFFLSETKLKRPSANVCFSVERKTIFGKIKSIHGPVKLETARNESIGFVTGKIICV